MGDDMVSLGRGDGLQARLSDVQTGWRVTLCRPGVGQGRNALRLWCVGVQVTVWSRRLLSRAGHGKEDAQWWQWGLDADVEEQLTHSSTSPAALLYFTQIEM